MKINLILQCETGQIIDVVGVILSIGEVSSFCCSNGQTMTKRDIVIIDDSHCSIKCTVFDNEARLMSLYANTYPILTIKGARVTNFCGRSINATLSSVLEFNLQIMECEVLLGLRQEISCGRFMSTIFSLTDKG